MQKGSILRTPDELFIEAGASDGSPAAVGPELSGRRLWCWFLLAVLEER